MWFKGCDRCACGCARGLGIFNHTASSVLSRPRRCAREGSGEGAVVRVDCIGVNRVCFANECARVKRHTGALGHASVVPTIGATRRACNVTRGFWPGFPFIATHCAFRIDRNLIQKTKPFFFRFSFLDFPPVCWGKISFRDGAWCVDIFIPVQDRRSAVKSCKIFCGLCVCVCVHGDR